MAAQGLELVGVQEAVLLFESAVNALQAPEIRDVLGLTPGELAAIATHAPERIGVSATEAMAEAPASAGISMSAITGVAKDGLSYAGLPEDAPSSVSIAPTVSSDSTASMSAAVDALTRSQVEALRAELITSLRGYDFRDFAKFKLDMISVLGDLAPESSSPRGSPLGFSVGLQEDSVPTSTEGSSGVPGLGVVVRKAVAPRSGDKLNLLLKGMIEVLDAFEKTFGRQEFANVIRKMVALLLDPGAAAEDPTVLGCVGKVAVPLGLVGGSAFFASQFAIMAYATASAIPCLGAYGAIPFATFSAVSNFAQIYVSLESARSEIYRGTRDLTMCLCPGLFEDKEMGDSARDRCTVKKAVAAVCLPLTVCATAGAVSTAATNIKAYAELGFSATGATVASTCLWGIRSILVARGICNLKAKAQAKIDGISACCGVRGQKYDLQRGAASSCGAVAGAVGGSFYTWGQRENIPEYFSMLMHGFGAEVDPLGAGAHGVAWLAFLALVPLNFMFMGDGVEQAVNYVSKRDSTRGRILATTGLVIAAFTGFPGVASVDTKDGDKLEAIGAGANAFIAAAASNYASLLALFKKLPDSEKLLGDINQLNNLVSAFIKYFEHVGESHASIAGSPVNAQKILPFLKAVQNTLAKVQQDLGARNLVGADPASRIADRCALSWCSSRGASDVVSGVSVPLLSEQPAGASK